MEIQKYFLDCTGKLLNIIHDNETFVSKKSTYISIGKTTVWNKANKEHPMDISEEKLNHEGFVLYTYGTNVVINGFCDRGKIYGAYEFVEDTLGVKFLNYRYDHIPSINEVKLYAYDETKAPVFQQRAYLNTPVFNKQQDYAVKMRFNSDYCPIDDTMGGYTEWCSFNGNTSHTMVEIVPRSEYAVPGMVDSQGNQLIQEEYRHIFAHTINNGEVVNDWASSGFLDYCFTSGVNDDGSYDDSNEINLVKLTVESLKNWIERYPNCENFMIGQNDTPAGCTCEKCAASNLKYKGGGRMVRFVNLINRQIQEWLKVEHPNRKVNFTMFAYLYTADAPVDDNNKIIDETCRPDPEVYVKYAPIRTATYYTFYDERQPNNSASEQLEKWSKITNRFHAWTYHAWYGNWLWYYPTLKAMQGTMKRLLDKGIVYEFAQGPYTEYNLYQSDIDAYVFSKLCWDLDGSVEEYRNEYIKYFFGEAAYEDILGFHDELDSRYAYIETKEPNMTAGNALTKAEYWPYESTKKMVEAFDNAIIHTMENDELSDYQKATYVESIERASLSARWMRLTVYSRYAGVTDEDVANLAKEIW